MERIRSNDSLDTPTVSVIMPVHNGVRYIRQAIESVLEQTFDDLELIIVDDASTDQTLEIVRSYATSKVRLIQNERKIGHAASANRAIKESRSTYIARLDGDDVSLPHRIERQVDFLMRHPSIGGVGTAAQTIDEDGRVIHESDTYKEALDLNWRILWHNCMAPHSSVMIRRTTLQRVGGYDERFWYAPDYDLWSRLSFQVGLAKLPEVLVQWRVHSGGMTSAYCVQKQLAEVRNIVRNGFSQLLSETVSEEMAWAAREVFGGKTVAAAVELDELASFVQAVYNAYVSSHNWHGSKDMRTARSDTIRMLLAIEQAKRRLTGTKDIFLLISAFRVSPKHFVDCKQFLRCLLNGTFVHGFYRSLRRLLTAEEWI